MPSGWVSLKWIRNTYYIEEQVREGVRWPAMRKGVIYGAFNRLWFREKECGRALLHKIESITHEFPSSKNKTYHFLITWFTVTLEISFKILEERETNLFSRTDQFGLRNGRHRKDFTAQLNLNKERLVSAYFPASFTQWLLCW